MSPNGHLLMQRVAANGIEGPITITKTMDGGGLHCKIDSMTFNFMLNSEDAHQHT
jgi:hypothetical protein